MKKLRIGIHFMVIVFGVMVFYTVYDSYLEKRINERYRFVASMANHANGAPVKDKGNIVLEESLTTSNMLIMGSSELSSPVSENPKNLFPNNLYDGDASFVGHAYVQNALHAMNLGANTDTVKDKDVVIVESLQWYTGPDISVDGFFSNFSELQFYEFINNPEISENNKEYLCKRYVQLENSHGQNMYPIIESYVNQNALLSKMNSLTLGQLRGLGFSLIEGDLAFPQTYLLARTYLSDSILERIAYQVTRPYYWARYKILSLKDNYEAYQWLRALTENAETTGVEIDWEYIYSNAVIEGEAACTNNNLFVYDDYYTQYLEEKYETLAGRDINVELMISKEWDDLEFFLNVCDDLDIQPYLVSMSTNGLYYDYIGIDKDKRDTLYDTIYSMASQHGYECLSLKDKEYEPYFYCDVMHLGWRGWPYVVQNIIEHFSE